MRTLYTATVALAFAAQVGVAQTEVGNRWPISTPDKLGLDGGALARLDAEIASGKYGNTDSMLVIRHGQIAWDRAYKHDYDKIYSEQAHIPGALNAHDFGGPYNYFNAWWHPFYRRGDLHTLQSVTKTVTSVFLKNGVYAGKQIVNPAWVKESLTPAATVSAAAGVRYGFKWWLYPYGKDDPRLAFAGSGFGGQKPIAIPTYDLVLVFTGWNILGEKGLPTAEAITRILEALKEL
jgi:hypothetical protein